MPSYGFGAGVLWATPLTDATGTAIANPSPVLFGTLQEVSVDISGDVKELYGQNQYADAVARGKAKIQCKAKAARFNGLLLNEVFFGQTVNTGLIADYYDTIGSQIPATSPYYINPTPPNSGTWSAPLAVRNSSGNPMTRVASAPATGQYSVAGPVPASQSATASFATNVMTVVSVGSGGAQFAVGQIITAAGVAPGTYITSLGTGTGGTGTYNLSTTPGTIATEAVSASEVYTFAAADAGLTVFIDYQYTATSTTAKNSIVSNLPMGQTPSFQCDLSSGFNGKYNALTLFSCIATKLSLATKLDDFLIPEFDFNAFANANNQVLKWATAE
jgi:hypothetical protein